MGLQATTDPQRNLIGLSAHSCLHMEFQGLY